METLSIKLKRSQSLFPSEVLSHNELKRLEVIGPSIEEIPEGIIKLTNLESFTIISDSLTILPKGLFSIPNLQFVKVKGALKSIPAIQGQPSPIKTLIVSGNDLTEINPVKNFVKLEVLDVSDNDLKEVPEFLKELKSLKRLNFDKNNIAGDIGFLKELPALNHLSLDGNHFSDKEKSAIFRQFNIVVD